VIGHDITLTMLAVSPDGARLGAEVPTEVGCTTARCTSTLFYKDSISRSVEVAAPPRSDYYRRRRAY
jgi:hypothetical protein